MKRIVSIVLTLTLLLSCVCFFVSAESEGYSGVYNGYNYYCYGQVTPDSCTVSMTYANSTPTIMIDGFYKYKNSDYQVFTEEFFMRGKLNTFVIIFRMICYTLFRSLRIITLVRPVWYISRSAQRN